MSQRLCLACGQDTPDEEIIHGYCPRCWKEVSSNGGRYGKNTIAVTVVEAMHDRGAINITFDAEGTLRQVQFPRPPGTKGTNGK